MKEVITRVQKVCRTCNKPFSISEKEIEWLEDKGLSLFAHCSYCRKKRKQQRKVAEGKHYGE